MEIPTLVVLLSVAACSGMLWVLMRRNSKMTQLATLREGPSFSTQAVVVMRDLRAIKETAALLWERAELLESYAARYELTVVVSQDGEVGRRRKQLEEAVNLVEVLIQEREWDKAETLLSYLRSPEAAPGPSVVLMTEEKLSLVLANYRDGNGA